MMIMMMVMMMKFSLKQEVNLQQNSPSQPAPSGAG